MEITIYARESITQKTRGWFGQNTVKRFSANCKSCSKKCPKQLALIAELTKQIEFLRKQINK